MSIHFENIVQREKQLLCNTYGRYPLAVSRAQGCHLYDLDGDEYLDLLAGVAVCSLGHSRADLAEVMAEQACKLVHVSNLFYQNEQLDLAEKLLSTCEADRAFFCNSGAEANEGAIKLARRFTNKIKKKNAFEIITLERSFHGRTLCTLTATGQEGLIKDGFAPLSPGFRTVPFDDVDALRNAVNESTCAVMIEMVQGEGGVRPLSMEYVDAVMELRREFDLLLIVDEVQTGMCRTGKFWAHEHYGIKPDIFTSAKALANGLPMGAVLVTEDVARGFEPGSHATTFGGGAVVSAVASRVVEIMKHENIAERTEEMGQFVKAEAGKLIRKYPEKVAGVRGLGLLLGIELTFDGKEVWKELLERRFVCNLTQGRILRIVPPLVIEKRNILDFLSCLDAILSRIEN